MNHSAKTPIRIGLMMLAVLVLGIGGWGVFASISGAIVGQGKIEVQNQRQIIQHPDGGVVSKLFVKEGDAVQEGQPILMLDGQQLRADLAIANAQYYEILARSGRLEAERDGNHDIVFRPELIERARQVPAVDALMRGQENLFAARDKTMSGQREQLTERIAQIESQITGYGAQLQALERQTDLIQREVKDKRSLLDRGLAQASQVMSLDREAARLEGEHGALIASTGEARGRIVETRLEMLNLDSKRREDASTELRDLGVQELQLIEQRAVLSEQISRLEVKAPVAGVVYGLLISGSQAVVKPADTVGYVVPLDRPLIITVRIQTKDIDNVHPGQVATLRFTAFSTRTTPELSGHVTVVSADAFEDPQTKQSYYRTEVALDPGELEKLGSVQIVPGMPVEVLMSTGSRSALSYLLKPVTDYFAKAFRES